MDYLSWLWILWLLLYLLARVFGIHIHSWWGFKNNLGVHAGWQVVNDHGFKGPALQPWAADRSQGLHQGQGWWKRPSSRWTEDEKLRNPRRSWNRESSGMWRQGASSYFTMRSCATRRPRRSKSRGLTHEYVVSLLILTYDQLAEVESCVKPSVYSDPKNFLHPKDSFS